MTPRLQDLDEFENFYAQTSILSASKRAGIPLRQKYAKYEAISQEHVLPFEDISLITPNTDMKLR